MVGAAGTQGGALGRNCHGLSGRGPGKPGESRMIQSDGGATAGGLRQPGVIARVSGWFQMAAEPNPSSADVSLPAEQRRGQLEPCKPPADLP